MAAALLLVLGGCTQQPERVASNCEQSEGCAETEVPLDRIDAVDILLVVDSSGSIASEAELLKAQLPRMLNAIVTGSDEDMSFPPASSVHVAVTTSDLGVGVPDIEKCEGLGDDGVFIQPGQAELNCELSYPGYLAYEGSPAARGRPESALAGERSVAVVRDRSQPWRQRKRRLPARELAAGRGRGQRRGRLLGRGPEHLQPHAPARPERPARVAGPQPALLLQP
jgi:hypothetical protein